MRALLFRERRVAGTPSKTNDGFEHPATKVIAGIAIGVGALLLTHFAGAILGFAGLGLLIIGGVAALGSGILSARDAHDDAKEKKVSQHLRISLNHYLMNQMILLWKSK